MIAANELGSLLLSREMREKSDEPSRAFFRGGSIPKPNKRRRTGSKVRDNVVTKGSTRQRELKQWGCEGQ